MCLDSHLSPLLRFELSAEKSVNNVKEKPIRESASGSSIYIRFVAVVTFRSYNKYMTVEYNFFFGISKACVTVKCICVPIRQ